MDFAGLGRLKEDAAKAKALSPERLKTIARNAVASPFARLSDLSPMLPSLREARDAFERAYFELLLAREGGSIARVAEKSGLERTHLYRKLKALGVRAGK